MVKQAPRRIAPLGDLGAQAAAGRSPVDRDARPCIVYFVNLFPNLIETMIYREVLAVRALGYDIPVISIRRPADRLIASEARPLVASTRYVLPVPIARLLRHHLRALVQHPSRYWQVLWEVLSGSHRRLRDRLRTLCHFAEAVSVLPDIEQMAPDHLHAHWAVGAATCAMVVSRFLEMPFTFTAHAYDIWREQLLLPEKLAAAALTVTCTGCNRDRLIAAFGGLPNKVRVIHHGLDLDRFSAPPRRPSQTPLILSVGRLVEQKGFDRLLRACASLAASGCRFRCEIIGEGPLRDALEHQTRELGLDDIVLLRGQLHEEQLIERYAAADIFALLCVPASDEDRDGIPNTLIEAMAMELPCVSTRFSGVPELVRDGETGLLVDVDDVDGAAGALRELLADPDRRRRLGAAGRFRVRERFTIAASAAALDTVFRGLLRERVSAAA
jgi:glycosyltransferase involved in cell wall biosynthesis